MSRTMRRVSDSVEYAEAKARLLRIHQVIADQRRHFSSSDRKRSACTFQVVRVSFGYCSNCIEFGGYDHEYMQVQGENFVMYKRIRVELSCLCRPEQICEILYEGRDRIYARNLCEKMNAQSGHIQALYEGYELQKVRRDDQQQRTE